jgi:hypothetical protein
VCWVNAATFAYEHIDGLICRHYNLAETSHQCCADSARKEG